MAPSPTLTNDEYSMIFSNHFGIGFKPAGKDPYSNDYALIFSTACQVSSAFIFAMAACMVSAPYSVFCWAVVACMIISRVVTFSVFLMAVLRGRYYKSFYQSSVMYWGWWPTWLLVFGLAGVFLGATTGSWLWSTALGPFYELQKLQKYRDINPEAVPGERIVDAGLVDFTPFVEMDRAKGGCFMNAGNTYCVAPIVNGGEVKYGTAGVPQTGSYDYFAVGINCCSCPNRDFQCGEWQNPLANSGIRSLDTKSRPYYQLALDDWQASYGKSAKHPMFFDWVQNAEFKWKEMYAKAISKCFMALAAAVSCAMILGFLLDKLLQTLGQWDYVSARVPLAPAPGLEVMTEVLLPKMFYRYMQEQTEIAAMPVSAEWKAQRGEDQKEDNELAGQYGATNFQGQSVTNNLIRSATGMSSAY